MLRQHQVSTLSSKSERIQRASARVRTCVRSPTSHCSGNRNAAIHATNEPPTPTPSAEKGPHHRAVTKPRLIVDRLSPNVALSLYRFRSSRQLGQRESRYRRMVQLCRRVLANAPFGPLCAKPDRYCSGVKGDFRNCREYLYCWHRLCLMSMTFSLTQRT
jgi:hypothetical protein